MEFTRELILQKVKESDVDFFSAVYDNNLKENDGFHWDVYKNEFEVVYDQNWGDGNDWDVSLHFHQLDLFVLLKGTYSSYGDTYWNKVILAMPYEFKETRYKACTLDYLRDKKLEEIVGK
jgi:hypothetical protein